MKTPEEIALIGGGILLSSGLVFGLKSGAASELPNVSRSVDTVLQGKKNADSSSSSSSDSADSANQAAAQQKQQQEQAQQQQADKFNNGFQQAQQNHWQTGNWGSAKFYVDDNENMHVGSGQLQSPLDNAMGINSFTNLKTVDFDEPVKAPQDSSELISIGNTNLAGDNLTFINNLGNLDTSQTTNMSNMFSFNNNLTSLDFSHFDTSKVTNMYDMFSGDSSLSNLDLGHFDTHNVNDMSYMFDGANIHQLTLGSNTKLQNNPNNSSYDLELSGTYQNNGQTLNLDGNAHPGTWYKQ